MAYLVFAVLGMVAGGICAFIVTESKRRKVEEQRRKNESDDELLQDRFEIFQARSQEFNEQMARLIADRAELDARIVSYREMQDENAILKRDLRNIEVNVRKLALDREQHRRLQESLDQRVQELGGRYLKDNVKWIGSSLNQNNFANCNKRLQDVIERCRSIGFDISTADESALHADLKKEYELVVRAAYEREEQARIKAQIREEQQRAKEVERERQRLQQIEQDRERERDDRERERKAIEAALATALASTQDQHSDEIEGLQAQLAEAQAATQAAIQAAAEAAASSQRALSMAQLTKAGYVYVISNIGSFGDAVFKVGMTRREDPIDRVNELGDASVPFPFDVHMMIASKNAPALENALHRALHKQRINKTNPRKEFFKTTVQFILDVVREHHGEVEYVADAEALQYRQSLEMSDEDQEFIEHVYDELEAAVPTSAKD